jgi:GNAT superfamily N-acetyltransferase
MRDAVIIRPFHDSLADAEGLLEVERATFNESPYAASEVQAMLARGAQRAWLALVEDRVIGFVIAFVTHGLAGPCWEVDLLAVHPDWAGHRVATRLVQAAAVHGGGLAPRARAAVATDNLGSARAFLRAGFRRQDLCELVIFRPEGRALRPWTAVGVVVREASSSREIVPLLRQESAPSEPGEPDSRDLILLLAERDGQPAGYAELIQVQTLLYRGVWIESLVDSTPLVSAALVHGAMSWAVRAELDEVGMMIPEQELSLRETFHAAGFESLGVFDWLVATLPLPGLPPDP